VRIFTERNIVRKIYSTTADYEQALRPYHPYDQGGFVQPANRYEKLCHLNPFEFFDHTGFRPGYVPMQRIFTRGRGLSQHFIRNPLASRTQRLLLVFDNFKDLEQSRELQNFTDNRAQAEQQQPRPDVA
jgi:hypothetical protein